MSMRRLLSSYPTQGIATFLFLLTCAAIYVAFAALPASYFPLLEADSGSYLTSGDSRTAFYPLFLHLCLWLGIGLEHVVIFQLLLFVAALIVLLSALLRAAVLRVLIVIFVVALGANGFFSSFPRTIMTESLFVSVLLVAIAFLLDYFRTGRAAFLAGAGLCVGLCIGIRPAGIALLPMLALAAWLQLHRRDVSVVMLAIALIAPPAIGPVAERLAYRVMQGGASDSVLPNILFGKAAMLVRVDTVFSGPHAEALNALGRRLEATYEPAQRFLDRLPSAVAWPGLHAAYESAAHFAVLTTELSEWSVRSGVPVQELRRELGMQAIRQNFAGYVRLTLIHDLGQWSINAFKFPATAKAVNRYVANTPHVPMDGLVGDVVLRPVATWASIVVYPAFLIAGLVTLILSVALLAFIVRPSRGDRGRGHILMLASFFAAAAQIDTFAISMINVSTPRFLMAVYPLIVLAGLLALQAIMPVWGASEPDSGRH